VTAFDHEALIDHHALIDQSAFRPHPSRKKFE